VFCGEAGWHSQCFRVAGQPGGPWLAFHLGDRGVGWLNRSGNSLRSIRTDARANTNLDLSIDRDDRCWFIENDTTVTAPPVAGDEQLFAHKLSAAVNRDKLACLKAGRQWVVVGGDDGYLRLLRQTDGAVAAEWPCFDTKTPIEVRDTFLTVRSTDLSPTDDL